MHEIPRAREVGQSWFTSLFYTLFAFMKILPLVFNFQPQLLLVNGPGTCVPVVIATWLLSRFRFIRPHTKIVFVESICRVKTLSMSAKLIWYFVDTVIVQWPELALKHKGSEYIGKFS